MPIVATRTLANPIKITTLTQSSQSIKFADIEPTDVAVYQLSSIGQAEEKLKQRPILISGLMKKSGSKEEGVHSNYDLRQTPRTPNLPSVQLLPNDSKKDQSRNEPSQPNFATPNVEQSMASSNESRQNQANRRSDQQSARDNLLPFEAGQKPRQNMSSNSNSSTNTQSKSKL